MDHSPKNISILIIEDNPADAFLLEDNLKSTQLSIDKIVSVDTLKDAGILLQQFWSGGRKILWYQAE